MLDYTNLPQNPILAIAEVFEEIHKHRDQYVQSGYLKNSMISNLMIVISSMKHLAHLQTDDNLVSACDEMYSAINDKAGQYTSIQLELHLANIATQIQRLLIANTKGTVPQDTIFEITDNDRIRVLKLTSEIRAIITLSDDLDDSHKNRLFERISAVEKEVHKSKGKFDVILAGVVDFGEALGRFGEGIKPLVERYNEIRGITQSSSKEYENLPAPDEVKRLPAPK